MLLPFSGPAQTPSSSTTATPTPPAATPPSRVEEVVVSAPEPRYVAPTTRDHIGRIWAPVMINGKGPYRLVLDTGATRSAIMQRVVDDARLPLDTKPIRLRGVTGTRTVQAAHAKTLAAVLAMPRAPLNRKHGKHRANTAHPFPDIPAHRWPAMVATAPARDR